jgi:hypothetical protein
MKEPEKPRLFADALAGKYGEQLKVRPPCTVSEAIALLHYMTQEDMPPMRLTELNTRQMPKIIAFLKWQGASKKECKEFVMLTAMDRSKVLWLMEFEAEDIDEFDYGTHS